MKIKKFDVVELVDDRKATILDVTNNKCYAEIVDGNGKTIEYRNIKQEEIIKILFKKDRER